MYEEVCKKYNLKGVINASGKMTTLGTSILDQEVVYDCNIGYSNFFIMEELHTNCNAYIANLLGVEDACITASTSSGIVLAISSIMTQSNINKIENLYDQPRGKVLILKGHMVNFGAPIKTLINAANSDVLEVGSVNRVSKEHLISAIEGEITCGLYVKSHHCVQKSMLTFDEFVDICHSQNVPVIVDASAEEDLLTYYNKGADIVIYSGAKAICGPTTGVCLGKHEYIKNIMPQYKGIGRAMKVGKEGILGITKALDLYVEKGEEEERQKNLCKKLITNLNSIYPAEIVQDKAGRKIFRVKLVLPIETAIELSDYLEQQNPAVEIRNHELNLGHLEFDMRALSDMEVDKIGMYIKLFVKERNDRGNS